MRESKDLMFDVPGYGDFMHLNFSVVPIPTKLVSGLTAAELLSVDCFDLHSLQQSETVVVLSENTGDGPVSGHLTSCEPYSACAA